MLILLSDYKDLIVMTLESRCDFIDKVRQQLRVERDSCR